MSDLNDPRVLFAAERTLLAWNRSSLTLMAFGFVIERFGLLLHTLLKNGRTLEHGLSFWVGLAFILLGSATALLLPSSTRVCSRLCARLRFPTAIRSIAQHS